MWEIHGRAVRLAFAGLAAMSIASTPTWAQSTFINQNISGFNLPGVQLPQGHDEVRAADGTTCRSAVSGSGAYMDVGVIGNPEATNTDSSYSAYTRVVIPLGRSAPRLDCSRLYNLEVQRLEMELKLMQMGLTRGIAPADEAVSSAKQQSGATELAQGKSSSSNSWDDDGWSTDGLKKN